MIDINLGIIHFKLVPLVISIACLIGFTLLSRVYLHVINPFLTRICDKTPRRYNTIIVNAFAKPTTVLLVFIGIYGFIWFFAQSLGFTFAPFLLLFINKSFRIGIILYLAWGLFNASDIFTELLNSVGTKLDMETGKTASRFLGNLFRGLVIAFGLVMIMKEFGYDVNGLLAGLGLGGLTVALAAKDSASNFFGGVIIIFEKPFEIGDWISSGTIEGTVEDINFRSTKVRTMANSLTIVPNSILAANPITNATKMKMRRAQTTLLLEHSTSAECVTNILMQIREYLTSSDAIMTDTVSVRLSDFTTEGINISVLYFTKTIDVKEYQEVKETINLKIMEILRTNDAVLTLLRKGI